MQTPLKTRTLFLLMALVFTSLALSLPEPAAACWMSFKQYCYYPNGVYCEDSPCDRSSEWTCSGLPSGTPSCHTEEFCCP